MSTAGMGNLGDPKLSKTSPQEDASDGHRHTVQFYDDESSLLEPLAGLIDGVIAAGNSAIVIATKSQRESLIARLLDKDSNLRLAMEEGRFQSLDTAETLAQFMTESEPDPARFVDVIGGLIDQAHSAAKGEGRHVTVFGQMIAILHADGKAEAAIRMERLWNDLAETHSFHLHCAYPISLFSQNGDAMVIQKICAEHSLIVPAERYKKETAAKERNEYIVALQQKAQILETEIGERKKAQRTLEEREVELKDFLENAVIGMHWVSADGTILWANKAELNLLGYEYDEYVGHPVSEFYADKLIIEDILRRLSRNEVLHDHEVRLKCKNGDLRRVRIDSNVFMRDGDFIHTRCFTTDITDKADAEEALYRLAAIVESSDDAIVSKDLNGIITSWNHSAERMFGYKPAEVIGRSITILIPFELLDDERHILSKIRAGERIDHFNTVRLHRNGDRIDVSLTVSPVKDRHGRIIGAAKILRDVGQQKKLEAALHTTERLASVGRLAASVAHEINNPLEAVTNFVYLARHQPEISDETRDYLNSADVELRRVAHIAQQTLGFYRDTSLPVEVVISSLIEDVLAVYHNRFQYKALDIELRISPGLKVLTLQGELKQILSNLISNAIDASDSGGKIIIRARISQHLRSAGCGLKITIADQGAGISSQDQKKIFEPFFTTKETLGTGLGLWITRDLLEKRGGSIRCRSRNSSPTGTVMSICLPLLLSVSAIEDGSEESAALYSSPL